MIAQTQIADGTDTELKPSVGPATSAATFATLQQNGQPRPPAPTGLPGTVGGPVAHAPAPAQATQPPQPAPVASTPGVSLVPGAPAGPAAAQPVPAAPTANTAFEQTLKDRATAAQAAPAPVFNPAANPFTPAAPTFAPSAGTNQVNSATQQAVLGLLGSSDPYTSDDAVSAYKNLSGTIDDQYAQQKQQIQEEMARRGIDASTIYGGRLQDSSVAEKSAKEQLAQNILDIQAQTNAAAKASAISAGAAVGGQSYSQDANTAQLVAALQSGNFAQALSAFQANQSAQGQQFSQGEQSLRDYTNFGQQGFNNQLATTQVNNQQSAQYQQLLQTLLGLQ
jgi:hypothetical protein